MNYSQVSYMPRNLTLIAQPEYHGIPVWPSSGPHIAQYLDRLIGVVDRALDQSSKIFAIRVDLHLPQLFDGQPEFDNQVIEGFIKSLRARVEAEQRRRSQRQKWVADGQLRYAWAREQASAVQSHYHLLLIFNGNFFQQLGGLEDGAYGLANMIITSWSTAIGQSGVVTRELVHFPDDACYWVDRHDPQSKSALLSRASYLCKFVTKVWQDGLHVFGASRG